MSIKHLAAVLALFIAGGTTTLAQEFSSLEDQMSSEDFERSGLGQLSKQELEHLNKWLQRNLELAELPPEAQAASIVAPPPPAPSAPAPVVAAASPTSDATSASAGFENKTVQSRTKFTSRIVGAFSGWTGKTRFTLENGQVWQQARGGSYRHRTTQSPAVTLVPKALNTWALEIEGLNRTVRVKRVK